MTYDIGHGSGRHGHRVLALFGTEGLIPHFAHFRRSVEEVYYMVEESIEYPLDGYWDLLLSKDFFSHGSELGRDYHSRELAPGLALWFRMETRK